MAIPGDAHYVPGSMRRTVQLGDGRRVSRQTAENIYARSREFRSDYERRQAYRQSKQAPGYSRDQIKAGTSGVSRRDYDEARALYFADKMRNGGDSRQVDHSPDGPLANYLVAIGRRRNTADYAVGDSPTVM
jgi:hypothetical protein